VARASVAAVLLALLVSFAAAEEEKPEPARKGERWEYGELHFRRSKKTGYAKAVTSRSTVEAPDWEGLAAKLKAPAAAKDADDTAQRLRVMDAVGDQGWELVGNRSNEESLFEFRSFKRRAAK
jgi:hypothetical protein